jgi:hypothetical protein
VGLSGREGRPSRRMPSPVLLILPLRRATRLGDFNWMDLQVKRSARGERLRGLSGFDLGIATTWWRKRSINGTVRETFLTGFSQTMGIVPRHNTAPDTAF